MPLTYQNGREIITDTEHVTVSTSDGVQSTPLFNRRDTPARTDSTSDETAPDTPFDPQQIASTPSIRHAFEQEAEANQEISRRGGWGLAIRGGIICSVVFCFLMLWSSGLTIPLAIVFLVGLVLTVARNMNAHRLSELYDAREEREKSIEFALNSYMAKHYAVDEVMLSTAVSTMTPDTPFPVEFVLYADGQYESVQAEYSPTYDALILDSVGRSIIPARSTSSIAQRCRKGIP